MRVLFIDNDLPLAELGSGTAGPAGFSPRLNQWLQDAEQRSIPLSVFASTSVLLEPGAFRAVKGKKPELGTVGANRRFLRSVDVVVLDLGLDEDLSPRLELQHLERSFELLGRPMPPASPSDLMRLNGALSGVGFFHVYREELAACQAVFVVTVHDAEPGAKSERGKDSDLVHRFIDPFCGLERWSPPVAKYKKEEGLAVLFDRLRTLGELFAAGYTKFDNLPEIELAARHDEPVMLVGESGTGKEYVARAIHRRWSQETERRLTSKVALGYASINCAQLSDDLAQALLFGAVEGAYTGMVDHVLGYVLEQGCGLSLGEKPSRQKQKAQTFIERCKRHARRHLEFAPGEHPLDYTLSDAQARPTALHRHHYFGTLFLDEIGYLSPHVQAQMLRYLESGEVKPLGYPGVIMGARLRVVCATSDPQFAAFAGFGAQDQLVGQWRLSPTDTPTLRSDILFRLKAQTIRVPAVTRDNVDAVTRRLIEARPSRTLWSDKAKSELIEQLKATITRVDEAQRELDAGRHPVELPLFGHKREISRILGMTESIASTAYERGARPESNQIGADEVRMVIRPSTMLRPLQIDGTTSGAPDPEIAKAADEVRSVLNGILATYELAPVASWSEGALKALYDDAEVGSPLESALKSVITLQRFVPDRTGGSQKRATFESALGLVLGSRQRKFVKSLSDWTNRKELRIVSKAKTARTPVSAAATKRTRNEEH